MIHLLQYLPRIATTYNSSLHPLDVHIIQKSKAINNLFQWAIRADHNYPRPNHDNNQANYQLQPQIPGGSWADLQVANTRYQHCDRAAEKRARKSDDIGKEGHGKGHNGCADDQGSPDDNTDGPVLAHMKLILDSLCYWSDQQRELGERIDQRRVDRDVGGKTVWWKVQSHLGT